MDIRGNTRPGTPSRVGWFFIIAVAFAMLPTLKQSLPALAHGVPPWLAVVALINRRKAIVAALIPVVIFVPVALYYQDDYGSAPEATLWLILDDCSVRDIFEYLGVYLPLLTLWAMVATALLVLLHRRVDGVVFSQPRWRWLCFSLVLIPLVSIPLQAVPAQVDGMPSSTAFSKAANDYFHESYPWSVLAGGVRAHGALAELKAAATVSMSGAPAVVRTSVPPDPMTLVLVIGESARRDHHGIYGYPLDTTPVADRADGLIAFSNMVTLYAHTVDSVPVVLAKHDRLSTGATAYADLIALYKAGGFLTSWISNQQEVGEFDSAISIYAKQADWRWFSRHYTGEFQGTPMDEVVIPLFRRRLAETHKNQLIVVHLYGSHEAFSERYPPRFALYGDTYDNTIRYTDAVIGSLLEELRQRPGDNALVYVADHGLKLNECATRPGHFDIKQSFEVPFYIWASASWREHHPDKWANAMSHRDSPATTMNVLDTLLDLADLRYSLYRDDASLFSSHWRSERRLVHTYAGLVDYDNGVNDGRCHMVARDGGVAWGQPVSGH